jgi:hypothetical protein
MPGTFLAAFSTAAEQEAQVMPSTSKVSRFSPWDSVDLGGLVFSAVVVVSVFTSFIIVTFLIF